MRLAAVVLAVAIPLPAAAQAIPDLEGGWVRIDPVGAGSWSALAATLPRAVLTPEGAALAMPEDPDDIDVESGTPHAPGQPYIVSRGRCGVGAGSAIEPNSAALFIVQTADEVLITREAPSGRHIYMDGRGHPATVTPSGSGHSIGRYEGGALVVETIGLTTGNVTAGGRRTPETRLTERYSVSPDGKRLTITYTWDDPKIYVKPHTYQLVAERLPADAYAFEGWCDSSDPLQKQSIVPPKQPR
jgi:hypothetical protein